MAGGIKFFTMKLEHSALTELLERHNVKPTANRLIIARSLADVEHPASLTELTERVKSIDKSNVFRALTIFREHHLVHVIEDGSDTVRYELCLSHEGDFDDDMHVHFYCERCERTFCFEDTPVPRVPLPEGYRQSGVNYVVKGLCPACARRTDREQSRF